MKCVCVRQRERERLCLFACPLIDLLEQRESHTVAATLLRIFVGANVSPDEECLSSKKLKS